MRSHHRPLYRTPFFNGLPVERIFDQLPVENCPDTVLDTINENLDSGRILRVMAGRASGLPCFFVEIAISGDRVRKLQISGNGALLSRLDGMQRSELPRTVKSTVTDFLEAGARFDAADRVFTSDSEEFHVELDLGNNLDLHLFLDERGTLLRKHEVGDY